MHLLYPLKDYFSPLNVLRYLTFRSVASVVFAFLVSLIIAPYILNWLSRQQIREKIREDGPKKHKEKEGTPTMGGIIIILSVLITTLFWADLTNSHIWLVLITTVGFGIIGFVDDYLKLRTQDKRGLRGSYKLLLQFLVALGVMWVTFVVFRYDTRLSIPFLNTERFYPDIGISLYVIFGLFVIMGTSNAVNLTDGLDGLAIGPTIVSASVFLVLSYTVGAKIGGFNVAAYLKVPHIEDAGELSVFCGAIVGASIGFLWYNTYPAQVFMGDVGALAIGGALGTVAILTKKELVSALVNGVFLAEALSVITQVTSYKLFGKRVFAMAPLHHHFELKGWSEPKIVVRFWIVSMMLGLLALSTLKLR